MYGPNYSGFAFHPKAIRMVGPVHFTVFLADRPSCAVHPAATMCAAASTHIAKLCKTGGRHRCWVTVFPIDHPILIPCAIRLTGRAGCRAHNARYPVQPSAIGTPPPSQHFGWLLRHLSPTTHRPAPKNKNGVFHVKHAARFPPPALTIKPSSSPARGTFRSRADSVPVRPPAPPAPAPPSPVHNRSPRSAVPPARSARSAASRHLCRATR